jgi:CheY-like chemotaxis protein
LLSQTSHDRKEASVKNQIATSARCRPVVYIAVQDRVCRTAIVDALHRQGWAVTKYPTGFHLIAAIADLIEGTPSAVQPALLVVDAAARGCSGITIAAGLRDLGVRIPVVIVVKPGDRVALPDDQLIRIVRAHQAASGIAEMARAGSRLCASAAKRGRRPCRVS